MANYRENYIIKLSGFCSIDKTRAAVLGCGFGEECELLLEHGAHSVDGFDIDSRIGRNSSDSRITYHRQSLTNTAKPSNYYDIVYSAAVFEHIHCLNAAFKEAERICKPGGLIFIISSPLWYSPYGNHMAAQLPSYPWCHLLYTPGQFRDKLMREKSIHGHDDETIEFLIDRIYDPVYFNRLPPLAYSAAVDSLLRCKVIRNTFWPLKPEGDEMHHYLKKCINIGQRQEDLCKAGHFFCARKESMTTS